MGVACSHLGLLSQRSGPSGQLSLRRRQLDAQPFRGIGRLRSCSPEDFHGGPGCRVGVAPAEAELAPPQPCAG
eukprot:4368317-Alexandrium_andersonii.AAC.1